MSIILALTFCYAVSFLFLILNSRKKLEYLNHKPSLLTELENKQLIKFVLPLTATTLSGVFFGYIDTILLGHFVKEEFIGYYSSAINLVGSAGAVFGFIGMAVFPIFARLKGKTLENAFKKTALTTFFISLFGAIIAFFFANLIIKLVYGSHYLAATPLLKIFSLMLILLPLSSIYESYLISIKKPNVMAGLLISTTILNILLNYFLILYGLRFSMTGAIIGSCIAVVLSRLVYFIGLSIYKRKLNKESLLIKK
jgi:O-antigen/teichoic acid export membrane protein